MAVRKTDTTDSPGGRYTTRYTRAVHAPEAAPRGARQADSGAVALRLARASAILFWPVLPWATVALAVSLIALPAAAAVGAPLWILGLLAVVAWLPVAARAVLVTLRATNAWLAFYLLLVISQTGHIGEHVVQMVQLRLLGVAPAHAHGVFGALDVEWVHFAWNSWVLLAIAVLLVGLRHNVWLWAAAALAAWHLLEHVVLIASYVSTGVAGSGLLATGGGLIGGGVLPRPDLHMLYNVAETVPLFIGFGAELLRSSGSGTRPELTPLGASDQPFDRPAARLDSPGWVKTHQN